MVAKQELTPSFSKVLTEPRKLATQGIGRRSSSLVVQAPHEAPEGESEIPKLDIRQDLTDAEQRIDDAEQAIEDMTGVFDGRFEEFESAQERARRLLAGVQGVNLIPNGAGEWGEEGGWYAPENPNLGDPIEWVEGDAPAGLPGRFVTTGTPSSAGHDLGVTVEPGGEYLFELWVRGTGAGVAFSLLTQSGTVAGVPHHIPGLTPSAPEGGAYAALIQPLPGEWTRYGVRYVMGESTSSLRLTAVLAGPVEVAGVRLTRMIGGEDIQAGSVAAQVGLFIDAMMENLTVTGVANIDVTVTDELYAKLAVVEKLQALEGIITTDMIATGAVTASKVEVTEELVAAIASILTLNVEAVNLGRDARWDEDGLRFYAPPAQGQDPTDWENRAEIISITPSSDVSISVAEDGEVTAGMSADGTSWAREGVFEEGLTVGGASVLDMIGARAGGVIAASTISGNVNIYTTRRDIYGVRATLEPGRMYRLDWHAGITLGTGTLRLQLDFPGTTGITYYRTQPTVQSTGSVTGAFIIVPTWAEGTGPQDVIINLTGAVDSGETIFRTDSWMTVEDKGPAVDIEVVNATNPTPPTQVHTRQVQSGHGWGVRPNGSNAVDPRLTVGGNGIYGSDMAEWIVYPIGLGHLAGSTVLEARLVLQVTQSAYASQGTAVRVYAGSGNTNKQVNLWNGTLFPTGTRTVAIPAAVRQGLVGKSAIFVDPFYPGNTASYGYMAPRVSIWARYRK